MPKTARIAAGCFFAETLCGALAAAGWLVDGADDWRDVGWTMNARKAAASLTVALARLGGGNHWMLQVAPQKVVGPFGRLLGRANSARPSDVVALALEVHSALRKISGVSSCKGAGMGCLPISFSPEPTAVVPSLGAGRDAWVVARRERAALFCARVALDAPAPGRSSSSLEVLL